MKKELSPGALIGIVAAALIVVGGIGFVYFNNASGAAQDKSLEKMLAESAKSEYGAKPGLSSPDTPGVPMGQTGEGAAQQANPGGKPGGQ